MKICSACGTQYPDDANFCPMDATRLPDPVAAAPVKAAPAAVAHAPVTDPSATLRSGTRTVANRFFLGDLIENSPTGELYAATDGPSGEAVRLKLINAKALPTAMMADRALREFKQLAKIKSERIARVVDQGKLDDGQIYIVTEALKGPTLEEVVEREGALSFDRAKQIVMAVGEALTEAQKVGVIHRDVAPRNIVMVGNSPKLTEFGVAMPVTDRVYGTPAFISPEQAEGKPVDQRSNIYSLGALLYYALVGAAPFEGDTQSLLQQHLNTQPKPPSQRRQGLGTDVDKLLLKALEKSGGRRHLTLRQLLNEVDALPAPASLAHVAPRAEVKTTLDASAAIGNLNSATVQAMPTFTAENPPVPPKMPHAEPPVVAKAPEPVVAHVEPVAAPKPPEPVAAPKPPEPVVVAKAPEPVVVKQPEPAKKPEPAPVAKQPDPVKQPVKQPEPAKQPAKPEPAKQPAAKGGRPQPSPTRITPQMASPQAAAQAKGKKGFRETGWFKKGELEEEFAQRAAKEANPDDPLSGPAQIEAVVENESLTDDDERRLSLKTGRTEAMPIIKAPVKMPGERMSDEDILAEVDGSKKGLVIGGVVVAVIAIAAVVFFIFLRGPSAPPAPAPGAAPAAGAPTAPAK